MPAKTYIDSRGWRYRVMRGLAEKEYKTFYLKPDNNWRGVPNQPWRNTRAEAQVDLAELAAQKGWQEMK